MFAKPSIFIINPLIYSERNKKFDMPVRPRPPLVLAYLQAILKRHYNLTLIDASVLGLTAEKIIKLIYKKKPQAVILTSTPVDRWECPNLFIDSVFKICQGIKNKTKTILIGTHGTVTPEWVLKKSNVDFVVRGEPEIPVVKLIKAIVEKKSFHKIKGISYKNKKTGKFINNPDADLEMDLDSFPFPAYEDLDFSQYRYTSDDIPSPFTIMLASRGCPFSCTFCLKKMMTVPYRVRKPEKIVQEMLLLQKKFGIKGIYFQDWEFVINKPHVEELCQLMINKSLKIKWGCNARATDFSESLMKLMKKAGCVRINIGFESGSQTILDNIKKRLKVENIENALRVCKLVGIKLGLYSLINCPGENKKTLKETARFLVNHGLENKFWWNYPIPYLGTELNKQGGLGDKSWPELSKYAGQVNVHFSPEEARKFLTRSIWEQKFGKYYFLNPRFSKVIWAHIRDKWLKSFFQYH